MRLLRIPDDLADRRMLATVSQRRVLKFVVLQILRTGPLCGVRRSASRYDRTSDARKSGLASSSSGEALAALFHLKFLSIWVNSALEAFGVDFAGNVVVYELPRFSVATTSANIVVLTL